MMKKIVLGSLAAAALGALEFKADGTFRMVQYTDLHYWNDAEDVQTVADTTLITKTMAPELVVLTGDVHCATSMVDKDSQEYKWKQAMKVFQDAGVPWAMTLGNHDPEGVFTQQGLLVMDQSLEGSLAQSLASSYKHGGYVNYYLPVYAHGHKEGDDPLAMLWLFDLTIGACEETDGDDCVSTEIVEWYRATRDEINAQRNAAGKGNLTHVAFTHVPPPEALEVWNTQPCIGAGDEDIWCPSKNTGLVPAMAEDDSALGIFFGHDHKNDYCGILPAYPNLMMCYGRKSGYGYYNPEHHGGRVIDLTYNALADSVSINTFVVDENSEIVDQALHNPEATPAQTSCTH